MNNGVKFFNIEWRTSYPLTNFEDRFGLRGLRMRRECRERFPHQRRLTIQKPITARAWRMCRGACRDRQLVVSFEVGGVEHVPGIPSACTTRIFSESG